jgi:hypothetical protein
MKLITKLQSYTDVITNSSSTVFVMHKSDAEFYEKDTPNNCCSIEEIDYQWLLDNKWNWGLVFDFLNIDRNTISTEIESDGFWHYSYWDDPDDGMWEFWIDDNLSLLQEKLFGLYYVDIEDHFEGAYEYIESASDNALKTEWRH